MSPTWWHTQVDVTMLVTYTGRCLFDDNPFLLTKRFVNQTASKKDEAWSVTWRIMISVVRHSFRRISDDQVFEIARYTAFLLAISLSSYQPPYTAEKPRKSNTHTKKSWFPVSAGTCSLHQCRGLALCRLLTTPPPPPHTHTNKQRSEQTLHCHV